MKSFGNIIIQAVTAQNMHGIHVLFGPGSTITQT